MWDPELVQGKKTWKVDVQPFVGHKGGIEDLVWSPTEARVFASAGVDHTVKVRTCLDRNGELF